MTHECQSQEEALEPNRQLIRASKNHQEDWRLERKNIVEKWKQTMHGLGAK